jgi:hypothetical protein
MARAYGANAQLLGKFETVYGTPPTGNYIKFPFVSSDLGSEQGLIASDLLGQGRDPSQPIRDVIRVEGNVVVPVDLRNFGHWLKALLGAPTTTGTGLTRIPLHPARRACPALRWKSACRTCRSTFTEAGVRVNSAQLSFARSGAANATLNCIAQGETDNATTGGGTPTVPRSRASTSSKVRSKRTACSLATSRARS